MTVEVTKYRLVRFKVGGSYVLVSIESSRDQRSQFSTWMTTNDWNCLVARQEEVDNAMKNVRGNQQQGVKRPRMEDGEKDVEQVKVESRSRDARITHYSWQAIQTSYFDDGERILEEGFDYLDKT